MYGSTEHPSITGAAPTNRCDSARAPTVTSLAGVEIRIVGDDGTRVRTPATPGEIVTRGPDCFAGYTDDALTARVPRSRRLVRHRRHRRARRDGCSRITDRKKDMIIRNGDNISAPRSRSCRCRLPAIAEVAVVAATRLADRGTLGGIPADAEPVAGRSPTSTLSAPISRPSVWARPKWPEELQLVDEFPRTVAGKVKKFELRATLRDR